MFRISSFGFRNSRLSIPMLETLTNQKRAIMQNKPNLCVFGAENGDREAKQTQTNPICHSILSTIALAKMEASGETGLIDVSAFSALCIFLDCLSAERYHTLYMRIPLTKYGWPQVVIFPGVILAAMIFCLVLGILFLPAWFVIPLETVLAVILILVLSFFRDPYRLSPLDKRILLSPADGRITDIEVVDENGFIGGPALRVGIFLSIFSAHINRAPCNVKVAKINYRQGQYKDARDPEAGKVNESNDVYLVRSDSPEDKLIVRQISGAIARRIVCEISPGQELARGEKFGMIKFGSRTELYLPAPETPSRERGTSWKPKILVKKGDKVKAGVTALVRYEKCQD